MNSCINPIEQIFSVKLEEFASIFNGRNTAICANHELNTVQKGYIAATM